MRKLIQVIPIPGVPENKEYGYDAKYGQYFIDNGDPFCTTSLIHESQVDFMIKAGFIKEELPKIWNDDDMIWFYHYVSQNKDSCFMDEHLTNFKQLKGII
jgi:hypothetical protein